MSSKGGVQEDGLKKETICVGRGNNNKSHQGGWKQHKLQRRGLTVTPERDLVVPLPDGAPRGPGLGVVVTLATETPVLLASGGQTPHLAVLVGGGGDPVHLGVATDGLVEGIHEDDLEELEGGILQS